MPQGLTPVVRGTLAAAAADDEFDSYVTSSPDATTAENTINTNVEDEKNSGFVHRPDPSHTRGSQTPSSANAAAPRALLQSSFIGLYIQ